jgi:hypothetical protein
VFYNPDLSVEGFDSGNSKKLARIGFASFTNTPLLTFVT